MGPSSRGHIGFERNQHFLGTRALASRIKIGSAFQGPEPGPGPGLPRSWRPDGLTLVGLGQTRYGEYIEGLVRALPCREVVAAGGRELGYLEEHCGARGQALIEEIAPVLDAFFEHIQSSSPGVWHSFTCQDAVEVIHEQLGRAEVLTAYAAFDPESREEAVLGFFLYCSYVFAMAAHNSPGVRNEIGIKIGPLLH